MDEFVEVTLLDGRKVKVNKKNLENYQSEVARSRKPTELPEFTITAKGGNNRINKALNNLKINREFATTNPVEYNIIPKPSKEITPSLDPNDPNFIHKVNLAASDAQVRNTAFTDDKTLDFWLNAGTPSQLFGAVIDGFQGGSYGDFVNSLKNGNSGFVSDNFYKEHPYWSNVINFVGDGVAFGSPKLIPRGASYAYTKLVPKDWQIARSINKSLYDLPLPSYTTEHTPFNWRYRLGDVEINDPNLNYRQGASGTVNDFLQSGKVRVKYEGKAKKDRTKTPGKFLLTKEFNNPMFKQGSLWYDGWLIDEAGSNPNYSDLLVTRQPLRFATKSSGPARFDQGGRRIPFNEDQLNINNTRAFVWKNGYGFRRIRPEERTYLGFYERPSKLTEAERAGIPKSERNNKSYHATNTYDKFYKESDPNNRFISILDDKYHIYNIPFNHTFYTRQKDFWDNVINPNFKRYDVNDARFDYVLPVVETKRGVGGEYFRESKTPVAYTSDDYPWMISSSIHEGPSHSSDKYVTPNIIARFNETIQKLKKLGKPFYRSSFNWKEYRATKNQIAQQLYKSGIDINDVSDAQLIGMLRKTNGYGQDYYYILDPKNLSNNKPLINIDYGNGEIIKSTTGERNFIDDLRHAIKYLPSALIPISVYNEN